MVCSTKYSPIPATKPFPIDQPSFSAETTSLSLSLFLSLSLSLFRSGLETFFPRGNRADVAAGAPKRGFPGWENRPSQHTVRREHCRWK